MIALPLALTACFTVITVSATNFTDCGSSARAVRSRVIGCEDQEYCPFIVGRNATFLANFTAGRLPPLPFPSLRSLFHPNNGPKVTR